MICPIYDKDDMMGWPLAGLSPQCSKVVDDVAVNAGGGVLSWLLKSWIPLSHEEYWGERTVIGAEAEVLRRLAAEDSDSVKTA